MKQAILLLEDGTSYCGRSFGADGVSIGEVVFNTSMTGYQEVITDPSYKGQLVTMTTPLIGNYGVNAEDAESEKPWLEGLIVKEYSAFPSNWRSEEALDVLLKRNKIVAIEGIDTRALTRRIRKGGAMQGVLSNLENNTDRLMKKLKAAPPLVGRDLVQEVSCAEVYQWDGQQTHRKPGERLAPPQRHVVAYDFGIKRNILRSLNRRGCRVTVVPARTTAKQVLEMAPDGILLSNGPGDPDALSYAVREIEKLLGKKPVFGICIGHQLLGLALGGRSYKLKFGHHGGNQPVIDLRTSKVEITAQNHGFAIDFSGAGEEVEVTHRNLNDDTVEGMRHRSLAAFSVQYHPEASPGPHDAAYLFDEFVRSLSSGER
ncbi:MAG: glutamine-hydrolyzing carbamoyl-phosphate synthase small subunit [Nitrospiria bacterium]